jgi:hypothetical protein
VAESCAVECFVAFMVGFTDRVTRIGVEHVFDKYPTGHQWNCSTGKFRLIHVVELLLSHFSVRILDEVLTYPL